MDAHERARRPSAPMTGLDPRHREFAGGTAIVKSLATLLRLFVDYIRFKPYIAKDRRCDDLVFDFLIADKVGKEWYDTSAEQSMPERLWCRDHIKPGFHVIDCGAHHGMMTVLFSRWTGPTGHVTAYEIIPSNRSIIRENLKLNDCSNVTIRPYDVGEKSTAVKVHRESSNASAIKSVLMNSLQVVSLDVDLAGSTVDFLKLDVEGAELPALRGACVIVAQQRPAICLELHNFLFADRRATLTEIFSIISEHNYEFFVLPDIFDPIDEFDPVSLESVIKYANPHIFCKPIDLRYVSYPKRVS